jgi:hypothetical protein
VAGAAVGGVCTIVAAVLTVVFTTSSSGGTQSAHGQGRPSASSASETLPGTAPSAASAAGGSQGSPSSVASQAPVVYQGPVEFGDEGINFDASQPEDTYASDGASSNTVEYIENGGPEIGAVSNPVSIGLWGSSAAPTYSQCRSWALAHAVNAVTVAPGARMCIFTPAKRTVYLVVTGIDVQHFTLSGDATVWSN